MGWTHQPDRYIDNYPVPISGGLNHLKPPFPMLQSQHFFFFGGPDGLRGSWERLLDTWERCHIFIGKTTNKGGWTIGRQMEKIINNSVIFLILSRTCWIYGSVCGSSGNLNREHEKLCSLGRHHQTWGWSPRKKHWRNPEGPWSQCSMDRIFVVWDTWNKHCTHNTYGYNMQVLEGLTGKSSWLVAM